MPQRRSKRESEICMKRGIMPHTIKGIHQEVCIEDGEYETLEKNGMFHLYVVVERPCANGCSCSGETVKTAKETSSKRTSLHKSFR